MKWRGRGHTKGSGVASTTRSIVTPGFRPNRAYGPYDKVKMTGSIKLKLAYKGRQRPTPTLPTTPFDWKSEDPVTSAPPLPTAEADVAAPGSMSCAQSGAALFSNSMRS